MKPKVTSPSDQLKRVNDKEKRMMREQNCNSRKFTWQSVQGVKDQGVGGRESSNLVGKGGVNELNEECVWEQGDVLVIHIV